MDSRKAKIKLEQNHAPGHATRVASINFPVSKIPKLLQFYGLTVKSHKVPAWGLAHSMFLVLVITS